MDDGERATNGYVIDASVVRYGGVTERKYISVLVYYEGSRKTIDAKLYV